MGEHSDLASFVVPVNLTWAMGFSWSSYIAQYVMTGCCIRAGLEETSFLSDERKLPHDMGHVVGVATNDIMHFSNKNSDKGDEWIDLLDSVLDSVGVLTNASKDVVGARIAICVGVDIVEGLRLYPNGDKLWKLFVAGLDLFAVPSCTPLELAFYTGTLQWFNLLSRWMLPTLEKVYGFNRAASPSIARAVPSDVLSELMHNLILAPFWEVDLCRRWHNQLVATDASPSYEFGVAANSCPWSLVRKAGQASLDPDSHIRLKLEPHDPLEKPRSGNTVRLPLGQSAFRTVLSKRAEFRNILEVWKRMLSRLGCAGSHATRNRIRRGSFS